MTNYIVVFFDKLRDVRALTRAARPFLRHALLALLIGCVVLGGIAPAGLAPAGAPTAYAAASDAAASADGADTEQPDSWLLKWRDPADAHELRGVEVLRRQAEAAVEVVRPADEGEDVEAWLHRLRNEPGVQYVHPNNTVHVLALPQDGAEAQETMKAAQESPLNAAMAASSYAANDPELSKQQYLNQIGAKKAWETVRAQTDLTIAIVDTGIDLEHPDLKANLVKGANLVTPNEPPQDDNGHGTGVAGVIAAAGNNGVGIAGILWQAKLMPIKALDDHGDGTEQDLGEAILYAVREGAKIVVLSVGLHRYSPYMLDIVQYAESKGVLLVAAAGNDGVTYGSKARVKYPAAYPTVLAVGGVKPDNSVDPRSNPGTELDIMAPWNVYTTAIGGLYKKDEGTSLAAPQVAAAAALVWARNPDFKPYQVRALLRQTAKDIGPAGVDAVSGYGLLQIDKAVQTTLLKDAYEPNNSSQTAARFPLQTNIAAELAATDDPDWFVIDAPYDGTLTIQYEGLVPGGQTAPPVRISHYYKDKLQRFEDTKLASRTVDFAVVKGMNHIQIKFINPTNNVDLPYLLTSSFTIKADEYEKNDKSYEAYTLQPRSQTIVGTFHQTADRDWFAVTFTENGKLQLSLSTDTVRIDPGLAVQRAGQQLLIYDSEGEGVTETSPIISVTPGKYFIRVHNAISTEASPTVGTYTLTMEYTTLHVDPNEPNDKSYEALMITPGTEYVGVIDTYSDVDWFQYRITAPSVVSMSLSNVPTKLVMMLESYDKRMNQLLTANTGKSGKLQTEGQVLQPGVYYVKLMSNIPFDNQYYKFKLNVEPLVSGFSDIKNHWAEKEIVSLAGQGIVNGIGNYRFAPDRAITRAEAVTMVAKAYKPAPKPESTKRFNDVSASHWAYDAITKAVQQGWIKGFPDGSFKPDQPITRAEMAVIIGYAEGVQTRVPTSQPFADVATSDWYAPMLFALKSSGKIKGKELNMFKPKQQASRAEFTVMLYRFI